MSKELQLKKVLIKTGIIVAVVAAAVLGISLFLSGYDEQMLGEQSQKQSKNNAISSEYKEIETNLGIENEVVKYYDSYSKGYNESYVIDRDAITKILTELRKKHHLANNVEVTVSPIIESSDTNFPLKSGKLAKSNVHIVMGALTDNSVYNFIYDLQHSLPGTVVVTELKLAKKEELSRGSVQAAVNQHNIIPLVTGDLSFIWLGINPNTAGGQNAR